MREAAYLTTSKDVGKWQQIVLQNRRAEQLVFPLKQDIAAVVPLEQVTSAWKVGAAVCHAAPGCVRSEAGMGKAQPVAEGLGRHRLSWGRFTWKYSTFLMHSRASGRVWVRHKQKVLSVLCPLSS